MSIRTGRVGRRGFLGRALLVGGTGALGTVVGSAGGVATAQAATTPRNLVRISLLGEGWHVLGDAGSTPQPGATPLTAGTLVERAGSIVGQFRSARLGSATLLHQIDLADGTIFGLGQGGLADADFAVVGGTGQYAGLTGGYTARQHPTELGGPGTATFDLSISFASSSESVLGALVSSSSAGS